MALSKLLGYEKLLSTASFGIEKRLDNTNYQNFKDKRLHEYLLYRTLIGESGYEQSTGLALHGLGFVDRRVMRCFNRASHYLLTHYIMASFSYAGGRDVVPRS